jgi:hypothetical protein
VQNLEDNYGTGIAFGYLCNWFKMRRQFQGSLHKASFDTLGQIYRKTFPSSLSTASGSMFSLITQGTLFWMKTHSAVRDAAPSKVSKASKKVSKVSKVRTDPLTLYIGNIPVSGDLCSTYNLMAAITGNPAKTHLIVYSIGTDNSDATAFLVFVTSLIDTVFLA